MTTVTTDRDTITVHVPLTFRRRGGRKQVVVPDGATAWAPPRARIDNAMIKAIARGFRWRKLLETGIHATVEDIAATERINPSYVSRVLRLTLLAPDLIEAILNGQQPTDVTLASLMKPFPIEWERQRDSIVAGDGKCAKSRTPPNLVVQSSTNPRQRIHGPIPESCYTTPEYSDCDAELSHQGQADALYHFGKSCEISQHRQD